MTKVCVRCQQLKNEVEFVSRGPKRGGFHSYCKPCYRTYRTWRSTQTPYQAPTLTERLWSKIDKVEAEGCWPWNGGHDIHGYGYISVNGQRMLTSRAMWTALNGEIPDGLVVRHTCDNPPCCNPNHLVLGTYQDNTQDMMTRGRHKYILPTGIARENHPQAKLTEEAIRDIRANYQFRNRTQKYFATKYGVCRQTIGEVVRNEIWVNVPS